MPIASLPSIPWQVTGNHWVALPCVHPVDGSVHALGLLHRGARSAVEFAGGPAFLDGDAPALARPCLTVDGERIELAKGGIAWERAFNWLPTFTASVGDLIIRGTLFAPFGLDADIAGAVYALAVENRGGTARRVTFALEGTLGHRQLRVRTPRALEDASRVTEGAPGVVVLDGASAPGLAALAIASDETAAVTLTGDASPSYALQRDFTVEGGARAECAFYIGAGPERDGAQATVAVLRRRGWRALLNATREALRALEQSTGVESLDLLVNRNLLFAYFYGVARGLDDAQYYLVRSRAPWHPAGVTIRDWEALCWTVPAVQLADPPLARELILRACELHGYAPGQGTRYLDGTLFEPGFTLEGCAAYAIAVDRYIRDTNDDRVVEDPVLADTLYVSNDDLTARRDKDHPLYHTEVALGGERSPQPFTLHGNAVVAYALDCLKRTLDEEAAKALQDPEGVRAALRRHFTPGGAKSAFVSSSDLAGHVSEDDDPIGSALWLPLYETVERSDSTYRRTAKKVTEPTHLAQQLARLMGPDAPLVLEWLRRAPLSLGVAAERVDAEGNATAGGGDAALAGLLAYATWFSMHAFGVRP
ncbi:MAG: hypothetical protein P3B98_12215 [Gemmatimonadota bacterium]|nr:hypothetical protein [Gemmatimonadota bacterium]